MQTVWTAVFAMALVAMIAMMFNFEPNHVFTPFFDGLSNG